MLLGVSLTWPDVARQNITVWSCINNIIIIIIISTCANGSRLELIYVSEESFLTFVDYITEHRIIAQRGGANEEMALWNHNAPARMQSA